MPPPFPFSGRLRVRSPGEPQDRRGSCQMSDLGERTNRQCQGWRRVLVGQWAEPSRAAAAWLGRCTCPDGLPVVCPVLHWLPTQALEAAVDTHGGMQAERLARAASGRSYLHAQQIIHGGRGTNLQSRWKRKKG